MCKELCSSEFFSDQKSLWCLDSCDFQKLNKVVDEEVNRVKTAPDVANLLYNILGEAAVVAASRGIIVVDAVRSSDSSDSLSRNIGFVGEKMKGLDDLAW